MIVNVDSKMKPIEFIWGHASVCPVCGERIPTRMHIFMSPQLGIECVRCGSTIGMRSRFTARQAIYSLFFILSMSPVFGDTATNTSRLIGSMVAIASFILLGRAKLTAPLKVVYEVRYK